MHASHRASTFKSTCETSDNSVFQTVRLLQHLQGWGCKSIFSEFLQIAYWPFPKYFPSFPDTVWNKTFPCRFCNPWLRGDYRAHSSFLDTDLHGADAPTQAVITSAFRCMVQFAVHWPGWQLPWETGLPLVTHWFQAATGTRVELCISVP